MNGELTFGQRLRIKRERAGKTRAVLGGLVGRSEEWVKAVETSRLLTPRLPMLLRLADVLGVDDLAELTGDQSLPVASITKAGRDDAAAVVAAINATVRDTVDDPSVPALAGQVDEAWRLWNHFYAERGAVAAILPGLITEARRTVRSLDGAERRWALAELARVYHLAQLYFAHQPAAEFVWLSADRAMTAAQDADDPEAIAAAAWYYGHVYRGSAQYDAAEQVATDAATLLDPDAGGEQLARWGQLQLGIGLGHAKAGRAGQAWRHWDDARRAAAALGRNYSHPWLPFGRANTDAYAVTVDADLFRAGEAIRRANAMEPTELPSRTRRAFYLIESARAHSLRREHIAVVHLLTRAATRESLDTVKHSPFARGAVYDLMDRRSAVREDARELGLVMGLVG